MRGRQLANAIMGFLNDEEADDHKRNTVYQGLYAAILTLTETGLLS